MMNRKIWDEQTHGVYQKWYDVALHILATNEQQDYEHPSGEIRLEMLRMESEAEPQKLERCFLMLQLQLFWQDPLDETHISMRTQNPAAMAMVFAGLELMDKEVDAS